MSELDKGAIEAVRDLALDSDAIAVTQVSTPDGMTVPVVAVYSGEGKGHGVLDMAVVADAWRTKPKRREGRAMALTLASFVELVNRHKDSNSAIFADIFAPSPSLTAVIDYHMLSGDPRFGRHRVGYAWPVSDEWRAWLTVDGKPLEQLVFAQFLEDHIADLSSPAADEKDYFEDKMQTTFGLPNQIAQLSRGLTIHVDSVVSEANVLQSGEGQIKFEESHKGADGKPLKVPGLFMLSIPLFFGGELARVPVRLRYRKAGGRIVWSFNLYRPRDYVRNALEADLGKVKDETSLPLYEGSPEA